MCNQIDSVLRRRNTGENCNEVGGICQARCDTGNTIGRVAIYSLLCNEGDVCCLTEDYMCSENIFGAFCSVECDDSMNSIHDPTLCSGFPETYFCCKPPYVRGIGVYAPDPVEDENGELDVPRLKAKDVPPPEEREAIGPNDGDEPPPDGFILSGETYGGIEVPDFPISGNVQASPGEFGDPLITTLDGLQYKFLGRPCNYILMQRTKEPPFRVVSHHTEATQFGQPATILTRTYIYYQDVMLELLEGNRMRVDGSNVTEFISTNATTFGNGGIEIKWNNKNKDFVTLYFGPGEFSVIWNGLLGHVIVETDLTDISGLIGNNNGVMSDDLHYTGDDGKEVWLDETSSTEEMNKFGEHWLDSC
uniref:Uncharacterized protein LOC102804475 n=1 Tax=Saccoglossus kowalevskii TaxID=10224 RepID=A0ABM0M6N9_SACKO|nr:PREDICTED: uncharacterized protein LOC102804475 [Saccoglossus kowalevskii]